MLPRHGIRLPFQKEPARSQPTAELTDISQVILPFSYATEASVMPAVSLYDTVNKGTPLSTIEDDPIAIVCSSVMGAVSGEREIQHPLYGTLHCAVIDCMPSLPAPEVPVPLTEELTVEQILETAESADIIDELDGVPLILKLREWQQSGCDFLAADGIEIEPFASSACAVLREHPEQVLEGLRLAALCVGAARYHIAACLPGSIRRAITHRIGKDYLYQTDSLYPKAEPVRFGKRDGRYTVKYGSAVQKIGVQACLALYRAVYLGESHDRCTVTVAGDAVPHPQNVSVPFGTTVQQVLAYCGITEPPDYLVLGEQMTGTTALTMDIPILAGMTCLLAFTAKAIRPIQTRTCIGCGRCVQVCHADLLPFEINRRFRNMHYERLRNLSPERCDGCNACSYICPCGIDLAATIEEAKHIGNTVAVELEGDTDA
ncbi:MAG: 4Fe-4S dicluster domain-containing protein [Clostridia bacterium]|nr:4Fe-4S dicluster domain-containing protein [Clostridia bacterium]